MMVFALQGGHRHRGVDLRGGNRCVAQQLLYHPNVRPVGQHVRCATVSKDVGRDARAIDSHVECPFVHDEINALTRQRA
jgi:hypothetical protein